MCALVFAVMATFPRLPDQPLEKSSGERHLPGRAFRRQQLRWQMSDFRMKAAVPAEMLARHADNLRLAIERVKGLEVRKHDSTDFRERSPRGNFFRERGAQLAEDPRPSLRRAGDHDPIRAGL